MRSGLGAIVHSVASEYNAYFTIPLLPWLVVLIPGFIVGRRMLRRFVKLPRATVRVTESNT